MHSASRTARTSPGLLRSVVFTLFFILFSSAAQAQHEQAEIPDNLSGKHLRWVIDVLNGQDPGDLSARFTPRFLEMVPEKTLRKTLTTLREEAFRGGEVVVLAVDQPEGRVDTLNAFISGEGSTRELSVLLVVNERTDRIAALRFDAAGFAAQDAGDWDGFAGSAGKLDGGFSFGAYEVLPRDANNPAGPQRLRTVYEFGEDKRLAIGSTFKLYVLGALAEKIAAGGAKWTDMLAIRDELKSLPSGTMQDLPAGEEHSLADFAMQMVSISDNTAADHLLHHIGRDAVETYYSAHASDPRTLPFLSTREMFTLKLPRDEQLMTDYAEADVEARRAMIAPGGAVANASPDTTRLEDWTLGREIERIEWFATARECCALIADMRRLEQLPGMEPLSAALRKNPGVRFDAGDWKSIAFKGGSEPGVLNATWLLERADGRWFAMSIGWNDPTSVLQEEKLLELAQQGAALLAREGEEPPADDGN